MIPERRPVLLEFVDHEEYVEVDPSVLGTGPIVGARTAFLHLRAPDGTLVRAQIPHEQLDGLLALTWPEDF